MHSKKYLQNIGSFKKSIFIFDVLYPNNHFDSNNTPIFKIFLSIIAKLFLGTRFIGLKNIKINL